MGTRSNIMKRSYGNLLLICIIAISSFFPARAGNAELVERIVAVVNDNVILLSELKAAMRQAEEEGREVNAAELIDGIINDYLLLEQAGKFSLGRRSAGDRFLSPDRIINNYIDKRIKALIYIPFRDVETYYYNNLDKYGGREFSDVKSEIEAYLLEGMLEIKLQQHIDELRKDARIRVQLK